MVRLWNAYSLYREIHSDEILTEAWHQVRTHGSDAAGSDGITRAQFQRYLFRELKRLQDELRRGSYLPLEAKPVKIAKAEGGHRSVNVLAVRDRVAQRAALLVLVPLIDGRFDEASFGFRPRRSTRDALEQALSFINGGLLWAVRTDIKDCFDSVDHSRLRKVLRARVPDRRLRQLIQQWIAMGCAAGASSRSHRPRGLLQGSPLAPFLANLYLDQLDRALRRKGVSYVRYADDILILSRAEREARCALKTAQKYLARMHLQLNLEKTTVIRVEDGLSFLGGQFVFDPEDGPEGAWVVSLEEDCAERSAGGPVREDRADIDIEVLLDGLEVSTNGGASHR